MAWNLWTLLTLLTLSTLAKFLKLSRMSTMWTMSAVSTVSTGSTVVTGAKNTKIGKWPQNGQISKEIGRKSRHQDRTVEGNLSRGVPDQNKSKKCFNNVDGLLLLGSELLVVVCLHC